MSAKKTRPTKAPKTTKGAAKNEKQKTLTQRTVLGAPVPETCPQGGAHEWADNECSKCHEPKPVVVRAKSKGGRARSKSKAAAHAKPGKARGEAKSTKLSALDAAAKVLAEAGEAMTTGQMIEAMAKKGYWSSPNGQTPAATLYSAILRQINANGKDARFKKVDRGQFTLNR